LWRATRPAEKEFGSSGANEVLEFGTLYAENCAGCHGAEGRGGAAIALANPVYLAIADDADIRKVIANGVRGTAMPAFAESAGGMLTDAQIDLITKKFARVGVSKEFWTLPPRLLMRLNQQGTLNEAKSPIGLIASLATARGGGGRKGSAITNDSFLALVSDQGLRTIVITGRPELGAPDCGEMC